MIYIYIYIYMYIYIDIRYLICTPRGLHAKILVRVSSRHSFHAVRDYLFRSLHAEILVRVSSRQSRTHASVA